MIKYWQSHPVDGVTITDISNDGIKDLVIKTEPNGESMYLIGTKDGKFLRTKMEKKDGLTYLIADDGRRYVSTDGKAYSLVP